jgi:hypothetical protein
VRGPRRRSPPLSADTSRVKYPRHDPPGGWGSIAAPDPGMRM